MPERLPIEEGAKLGNPHRPACDLTIDHVEDSGKQDDDTRPEEKTSGKQHGGKDVYH